MGHVHTGRICPTMGHIRTGTGAYSPRVDMPHTVLDIDLEEMDRQLLGAFFIIPYSMFRPLVSHKVCWLFTSGLPVLSVAYACDRLDLQVPRAIFSIMWRYI